MHLLCRQLDFWTLDDAEIDILANNLIAVGVDLEEEDDAAGFLGVQLQSDPEMGLLELTQTGLIDHMLKTLGLDDGTACCKWTPAEAKPLVNDKDGPPMTGDFSYSSAIGMLLYLAGHSQPDIAYALNGCARYMFCAKHSHVVAIKQIWRYLKATQNREIVLNPSKELKMDCYPDADFAGLYGHEKPTDPASSKGARDTPY